jgi:hypothetical protein
MNIHFQLAELVRRLRIKLYYDNDRISAMMVIDELHHSLSNLPVDDESIIGAESHAIFEELSGNIASAMEWRRREIELMQRLHEDIRTHDYEDSTRRALLEERGEDDLIARYALVGRLFGMLKHT